MDALSSPEPVDDETARTALRDFFQTVFALKAAQRNSLRMYCGPLSMRTSGGMRSWHRMIGASNTPDGSRIAPSRSRGATNGR